nr:MAG TPA: hypothetical protein [Caudoviricetes sp.]
MVYTTNQAWHNQAVRNDGEANYRYESANSRWSCFKDRVHKLNPVFLCLRITYGHYI